MSDYQPTTAAIPKVPFKRKRMGDVTYRPAWWADEYLTVAFITPLYLALIPGNAQHVAAAMDALEREPWWLVGFTATAVAFTLGPKATRAAQDFLPHLRALQTPKGA